MKNIVFDMGRVLLTFQPEIPLDKYCTNEEAKIIINRELFQAKEWVACDLGDMDKEERFASVSTRVPQAYHEELRLCNDNWHRHMKPMEGAEDFIAYVKAMGCRCYVLSNASEEFYEYFPREYDTALFDGILVSSDEHLLKPGAAIYECLLARYDLKPEESLFIDDVSANVDGARAVGMNAVQFNSNFEDIRKRLEKENG